MIHSCFQSRFSSPRALRRLHIPSDHSTHADSQHTARSTQHRPQERCLHSAGGMSCSASVSLLLSFLIHFFSLYSCFSVRISVSGALDTRRRGPTRPCGRDIVACLIHDSAPALSPRTLRCIPTMFSHSTPANVRHTDRSVPTQLPRLSFERGISARCSLLRRASKHSTPEVLDATHRDERRWRQWHTIREHEREVMGEFSDRVLVFLPIAAALLTRPSTLSGRSADARHTL